MLHVVAHLDTALSELHIKAHGEDETARRPNLAAMYVQNALAALAGDALGGAQAFRVSGPLVANPMRRD